MAPADPLPSAILSGYAKGKVAGLYEASASHWAQGGLWEITPVKAFAWSVFLGLEFATLSRECGPEQADVPASTSGSRR